MMASSSITFRLVGMLLTDQRARVREILVLAKLLQERHKFRGIPMRLQSMIVEAKIYQRFYLVQTFHETGIILPDPAPLQRYIGCTAILAAKPHKTR